MHPILEKLEKINEKLIPFAVAALLIIIILELFVHIENHTAELVIEIIDGIIIAIFVVDLFFLAKKAKNTRFFFKNYWLDIIAIFPFQLFLKFLSRFYLLISSAEKVAISQAILHESVEVGKVASKAEKLAKVGKGVRIGARLIRVITKGMSIIRFKRNKKTRR